ncbi:MAG: hypothetical protein GY744_04065 [Gammaproteobacteria bacterium]|nr:hypothetical protein [Gammaproteobacteria bacterium]
MSFKLKTSIFFICLTGFLLMPYAVGAQENNRSESSLPSIGKTAPAKRFSRFRRWQTRKPKVIEEERSAWLEETKHRLERFQISDETQEARIKTYESGLVLYWIDDEALIRFEGEEWLYIVTHSGHLFDGVGNAILAVDNTGNLYSNPTHVCDGISIDTRKGKEFHQLSDFLKKKVDDGSWVKLESE